MTWFNAMYFSLLFLALSASGIQRLFGWVRKGEGKSDLHQTLTYSLLTKAVISKSSQWLYQHVLFSMANIQISKMTYYFHIHMFLHMFNLLMYSDMLTTMCMSMNATIVYEHQCTQIKIYIKTKTKIIFFAKIFYK